VSSQYGRGGGGALAEDMSLQLVDELVAARAALALQRLRAPRSQGVVCGRGQRGQLRCGDNARLSPCVLISLEHVQPR